ncbi:MAG: transglutaminase domain-containing protein [Clostridiaceae bacterium]|nr:transglutaminase domain-containing protein [Clostridiaceae bacterium]
MIDTGSTRYGVALLRVDSIPASKRCKAIVLADKSSYQYDIVARNTYLGIPLQLGNGTYTLTVYEQVEGTSYTPKMSHSFSVSLQSSLRPFTASSIMSDFSRGSGCVSKAGSLCSGIDTQDGKVSAVYSWIVSNIAYDRALASSITKQQIDVYLPDPDRTYSSRKGICYDYASLMCAMLRSQGIPTRLIKGSTPLGYHAWNEVFFEGRGWVVVAAFRWKEIDGAGWVMLDSTFAASGMSPEKILSITHTKQKTY